MTQEYINELLLVVDFMDMTITAAQNGSEYARNLLNGRYANQYGYILDRYDISFVTITDLHNARHFVPQKVSRILAYAMDNEAFMSALED